MRKKKAQEFYSAVDEIVDKEAFISGKVVSIRMIAISPSDTLEIRRIVCVIYGRPVRKINLSQSTKHIVD